MPGTEVSSLPMKPAPTVSLTPGKRVLFLTKDPDLIRRQLSGELDLRMEDLRVSDLMDDINTDAMTPAWACFDYRPEDIARNAYAGITVNKERLFPEGSLMAGGFEVIVSGYRKGVGSSRETAVQAEKWSGIRIAIAASFAPIHARNNVSQGVLMGDHAVLTRLQRGEQVPLDEFTKGYDVITKKIIEYGGLFPFTKAYARGEVELPAAATTKRPLNIAEKVLAAHVAGAPGPVFLAPGDAVCVRVDGGYSHEFTTAQVAYFLAQEFGPDYGLADPRKFAVFEDHLIYADGVAKMAPFSPKIQVLRDLQRAFQRQTGVLDFSAREGVSPGICHSVARERIIEPGDFIQATDSHTCMGGANNSLAYGVGATEYAALVHAGFTFVEVPEAIRFELVGRLAKGVTAKDVMLHILATHARRPGTSLEELRRKIVRPDPGAEYAGGVHTIDLGQIRPMVATPGDQAKGIPSDPTNGAVIADLGEVRIDIAYGGSCTAGKEDDLDMYAKVMKEALDAGRAVRPGVEFYIQFGSESVEAYARGRGYVDVFEKTGVRVIHPGCGACIGCGPGVSSSPEQVTVSAINRNYQNRSGPGRLYLASPLTVAASAVAGRIVAYEEGMFAKERETATVGA